MNPTHVLCPVDFSEATPVGVHLATAVGRHYGARLTLLHVLPTLQAPFRVPVDTEDLYDQWVAEARERLNVLATEARQQGVPARGRLGRGSAVQEIHAAIDDGEADLVVLPTRSQAGLDRLLYGSVAERVVRVSAVPVLSVPPAYDAAAEFDPRKVLVATDLSRAAESAFEAAVEAAIDFQAALVLVHVFTFEQFSDDGTDWWRPTFTNDQVEHALADATERLERLADRARRRGLEVETVLGQGSNPAAEIIGIATDEGADLVVITKHGGFLRHLLLGSTAEKLVRSCPMPLLTVPPAEHEPAEGTLPDPVPA